MYVKRWLKMMQNHLSGVSRIQSVQFEMSGSMEREHAGGWCPELTSYKEAYSSALQKNVVSIYLN